MPRWPTLLTPGGIATSLAASALQPIFDGGLLRGNLEQAKGRYQELLADYRKAVVQGFTDVEAALIAWRYTTEQEAAEQQAVNTARRAADIARAQLAAGTVDITTVLNTETDAVHRRGCADPGPAGPVPCFARPLQGAGRRLGATGRPDSGPVPRVAARAAARGRSPLPIAGNVR